MTNIKKVKIKTLLILINYIINVMSYALEEKNLDKRNLDENLSIKCKLEIVDIRGNNPEKWNIL